MITPEISRSWHLVNGTNPEVYDLAVAARADQIVLDVEDGVDPGLKAGVRSQIVSWLEKGNQAWVRINDRPSAFWADDLDELRGVPGLLGVMLAKTESGDQVSETFHRLGGDKPVLALVETALGIEEARDIASAEGIFRLAFGSGDYRRDTGASVEDIALAYPRSRLVLASRIGNIPGPIDGPTVDANYSLLREKTLHAHSLGMTGKLCLDNEQIAVINEAMSPTQSDVSWARSFLADFEARGRVVRDGSDPPRLARAEKIDRLAQSFGIHPV